jgi:transcriptional regulator with XRE-family HTH domain
MPRFTIPALREYRVQRGCMITDPSGLSVSYLSRIERGLQNPPPEVKMQIAHALGITVARLFPPGVEAVA